MSDKLDCAMIALRLGLKRSAMDFLKQALAIANRERPDCKPFIMRAMNYARRMP